MKFNENFLRPMVLIGLITSHCLGNEPALLPRRHGCTRDDSLVSLNQSDNRLQIFVGHKLLSRQFGLRPVIADDGELINGIRENFRDNEDRKFRNSQQEMLEIFVNGQDVFIFQPTNCMNLKPQSNDAALLKKNELFNRIQHSRIQRSSATIM